MKDDKLTMLMILDGFGDNKNKDGNAIKLVKTPNIDRIMKSYPNTDIYTSGLQVGLPEGQMGNSEVGHTNIGAGRIVYQELTRITKSIEDGDFFQNLFFLPFQVNHINVLYGYELHHLKPILKYAILNYSFYSFQLLP